MTIKSLSLIELAGVEQHLTESFVNLECGSGLAATKQEIGEPQGGDVVRRIEIDEFLVGPNCLFQLPVLDVPIRQDLVLPFCLDHQTLIEIESGKALEDVEALGVEALDLLENRDRLGREPITGEVVGDFLVKLDRPLELANPPIQITHSVNDGCVVWKFFEDLLVLTDRLLELALLDKLFGIPEDFVPFQRHL